MQGSFWWYVDLPYIGDSLFQKCASTNHAHSPIYRVLDIRDGDILSSWCFACVRWWYLELVIFCVCTLYTRTHTLSQTYTQIYTSWHIDVGVFWECWGLFWVYGGLFWVEWALFCMHVELFWYSCIYTSWHTYTYTWTHSNVGTQMHVHVYIHIHTRAIKHTLTYARTCATINTCTFSQTHTHVCT